MFATKENINSYKAFRKYARKAERKSTPESEKEYLIPFAAGYKAALYKLALQEIKTFSLSLNNGCNHVLFKTNNTDANQIKNMMSTSNIIDVNEVEIYSCPNCGQIFIKQTGSEEVITLTDFFDFYLGVNDKEEIDFHTLKLPIINENKYVDVNYNTYPSFLYLRAMADSKMDVSPDELAQKIQIFSDEDEVQMDKITSDYNKKIEKLSNDGESQEIIDETSIDYSKKMERITLGISRRKRKVN